MNDTLILVEDMFGHGALDRPDHYEPYDQSEIDAHKAIFDAAHEAWEKLTDEQKAENAEPVFVDLPADPHHNEIASAMQPAVWVEKDMTTGFTTYPKRNQAQASDCTCFAMAKQIGIDNLSVNGVYRELSPHSIYPFVFVRGGGASSVDVANHAKHEGMTLESLYASDGLTEAEAEDASGYSTDAKVIAQVFKIKDFVQTPTDFETIASILQSYQQQGIKKGVGVTIVGFNNGSWLSRFPAPPASANQAGLWYHRIVVTDFGLIGGKKFLSFDNSWGITPGNNGQQFLGEEYQPFIYGGIYTIAQSKADGLLIPQPPVYKWSEQLQAGASGPDVLALQQALQSLGMFPITSLIKPTGFFGGLTQQGVKLFQASFDIPQTGIVGPLTLKELNRIFGA